jgi:hypothetical protein
MVRIEAANPFAVVNSTKRREGLLAVSARKMVDD